MPNSQYLFANHFVNDDVRPRRKHQFSRPVDQPNAATLRKFSKARDVFVDGTRDALRGFGVLFADALHNSDQILGGVRRPPDDH